jgi:hypothetical protein
MAIKHYVHWACIILLMSVVGCNTAEKTDSEASKADEDKTEKKDEWQYATSPVSHRKWDELVKAYVSEQGMINYKGMKQDEAKLDEYLTLLSSTPVKKGEWTEDQQLAYWINAYNAYTVKLILNHYPLQSIKDIKSEAETPWDIGFFEIGGKKYTLNEIEHQTLRKQFETDPRYHFALVCAAMSCPRLRTEAYIPEILDEQLDDQGRIFIAASSKNEIVSAEKAVLSPYFDWYAKDFKQGDESVIGWVNKFSDTKLNKDVDISYKDYDWSLNEQK